MTEERIDFKVKLVKVSANENKLRTNEIVGECKDLPQVGKPFSMTAEGIDFGTRWVQTSVVKNVSQEIELHEDGPRVHYFLFDTENSQYRLEILNKEDFENA
jgi:hypothetical protein